MQHVHTFMFWSQNRPRTPQTCRHWKVDGALILPSNFCCRVDVTLKRFKDNVHIGMSSPVPSARDCKLALNLVKAQWEHACTIEDTKPSLDLLKGKATE